MPMIGGVFVPDSGMPGAPVAARERPGYGQILGSGFSALGSNLRYGFPRAFADDEDQPYYQQKLNEAAAAQQGMPQAASLDDLTSGRVGLGRFATENLVASVPHMIGAVAGGLAGGAAGSAVGGPPGLAIGGFAGAVAGGMPGFIGANIARASEDQELTQAEKVKSVAWAAPQAAADAALGKFVPGFGKFLGPLGTRVLSSANKGFVARTGLAMGEAAATEAITETAQQFAERHAAGLPLSSPEAWREYVQAGVTAMAVGGLVGMSGGIKTKSHTQPPNTLTNQDIGEDTKQLLEAGTGANAVAAARTPVAKGPIDTTNTGMNAEQLNAALGNAPVWSPNTGSMTQAELLGAGRFAQPPLDLADVPNASIASITPQAQAALANPGGQVPGLLDRANVGRDFDPATIGLPPSDTSAAALYNEPVGTQQDVVPAPARPLINAPHDVLNSTIQAVQKGDKNVDTSQLRDVVDELNHRTDELQGTIPTTPQRFQMLLTAAKQGIRGGWVEKLKAANPEELYAKATAYANENTGSLKPFETKFLQRIGVINEDGSGDGPMGRPAVSQAYNEPVTSVPPAAVPQVAGAGSAKAVTIGRDGKIDRVQGADGAWLDVATGEPAFPPRAVNIVPVQAAAAEPKAAPKTMKQAKAQMAEAIATVAPEAAAAAPAPAATKTKATANLEAARAQAQALADEVGLTGEGGEIGRIHDPETGAWVDPTTLQPTTPALVRGVDVEQKGETQGQPDTVSAGPAAVAGGVRSAPVSPVGATQVVPQSSPVVNLEQAAPAPHGKIDKQWLANVWGKIKPERHDDTTRALNPRNQIDGENKVMHALGAVDVTPNMERIAQDLGLLNDRKELTDQGRAAAMRNPAYQAEIDYAAKQAAKAGGYEATAARIAAFGQGVSDVLLGRRPARGLTQDTFKAYQDGRNWAKKQVKGEGPKGGLVVPRTATRKDTRNILGEYTPQGGERENVVRVTEMPENVAEQAANRRAIEAAGLSEDVAKLLYDRVDQGATAVEIDRGIEQAQQGKLGFQENQGPSIPPAPPVPLTAAERAQRRRQISGMGQAQVARREWLDKRRGSKSKERVESAGLQEDYAERQWAEGEAEQERLDAMFDEIPDEEFITDEDTAEVDDAEYEDAAMAELLNKIELRRAARKAAAAEAANAPEAEPEAAGEDPTYTAYKANEISYNQMSPEGQAQFQADRDEENYQGVLENEPGLTREEYEGRKTAGMAMFKEFLKDPDAAEAPKTDHEQIIDSLRSLVDTALAAGFFDTTGSEARAKAMHHLLDNGNIDRVAKLLKDFDPTARPDAPSKATVEKVKGPVAVNETVVHGQLTPEEKKTLANHYGFKVYAKNARAAFMADFTRAVNQGYHTVAKVVADIVANIRAGALAVAMVFNPAVMTSPQGVLNTAPVAQTAANVMRAPAEAKMSPEAQRYYARLAPMARQSGVGFQIVDKANAKIHMFRVDGSHIASDTVLTGETQVDTLSPERLSGFQGLGAGHRMTPAGLFKTKVFEQSNAKGRPLGLMLHDAKTGKAYGVAIHTTVADVRLEAIRDGIEANNAVTLGCVSVNPEFYEAHIKNDIDQFARNLVFVMPYDQAQADILLPEQASPVERTTPLKGQQDTRFDPGLPMGERPRNQQQAQARRREKIPSLPAFDAEPLQTAAESDDIVGKVTEKLGGVVDKVKAQNLSGKFRKIMLGWQSLKHIVRQTRFAFKETGFLDAAHTARAALRAALDQMTSEDIQAYEKLEKEDPNSAKWTGKLMMTAMFGVDHEKPWAEHTHLHKEPNAADLKKMHEEAFDMASKLKRKGHYGVYQNFRAHNETNNYTHMAAALYNLIAASPDVSAALPNLSTNPGDAFLAAKLSDPRAQANWWRDLLANQTKTLDEYIKAQRVSIVDKTSPEARAIMAQTNPLQAQLMETAEALGRMRKSPYFHMGRFGDHFARFTIKKNGTIANKASVDAIAKAFDAAGIGDATISTDNTNPSVYIRTDTEQNLKAIEKLANQLRADGHIEGKIEAGPRSTDKNYGYQAGVNQAIEKIISSIEASTRYDMEGMDPAEAAKVEQAREQMTNMLRSANLEHQLDSSTAKVLTQRFNVQGFSPDMIRAYSHRQRVGSIALANMLTQPKFNHAYQSMKSRVEQSKLVRPEEEQAEAGTRDDPYFLQDVYNELRLRQSSPNNMDDAGAYDRFRATTHNYFLAGSPAYLLVNMTALGSTLWPELSKKHGYARSSKAIFKGGRQALEVLKSMGKEVKEVGWQHMADVAITDAVIDRTSLDDATKQFIKRMLAKGVVDIGSQGRENARVQGASSVADRYDKGLRLASSLGMASETFSRLTAALAARELHGGTGPEVEDYAARTVSDSMFDFSNFNVARKLGKQGFAGPVTPVITQFMQWSIQLMEKLVSETQDAFVNARPGEDPTKVADRKREARRYLLSHLTATGVLAGTMGLPFASVVMALIEKVVDGMDDDEEPYDATAAYRNFLADTFGEGVGEVLARGAPRAAGFDVSQRVGEADLLPFSKLLGDRRPMKDAVGDSLARGMGAGPSMLMNIGSSFEKMANGRMLDGMIDLMPTGLKNPLQTYRMTEEGYVDAKGNTMPLTPRGASYMWQALGFSPAEKAEYGEARGDQLSRTGELTRTASALRNGIVQAMIDGDRETALDMAEKAIKLQQDVPAYQIMNGIEQAYSNRMRLDALARVTGQPSGIDMKDVAANRLTRYANLSP